MSEKKEYRRIKTLTTKSGKKRYNLRKRKYSDCCELCGRTHTNKGVVARIVYHHWDDGNLNKGIWVCTGCHFLVEKLDNEFSLVSKYFSMKRTLDDYYKKRPRLGSEYKLTDKERRALTEHALLELIFRNKKVRGVKDFIRK